MISPTPVFGLHPSSRGFGWVLFEDSDGLAPSDWGTADIRGDKNAAALNRIEALLDRHRPAVLAMERLGARASRRSERIRCLYRAAVKCAERRDIKVHCYSRAEISNVRRLKGARTREQVAAAVANCVAVLRPRLPRPRPIWIGERSAMSLFCAAACALAHFDAQLQAPD
jgi:Holliday junction resolvasome RuvABC endonuclease subunit